MDIRTGVGGGGVSPQTYRASKYAYHLNHYWERNGATIHYKKWMNFASSRIVKQTQCSIIYKYCNYEVVVIIMMTASQLVTYQEHSFRKCLDLAPLQFCWLTMVLGFRQEKHPEWLAQQQACPVSSAVGYPLDLQRTGWWYVLWTDFLGAILLVEVLSQHQKYVASISYCAHTYNNLYTCIPYK